MAFAYVQSASVSGTSATTSVAKAFTSNVVTDNLIVVGVSWGSAAVIESCIVTDTLGNTYMRLPNCNQIDATNQQQIAVFYARNITGGACTVTATFAGSRDNNGIAIAEYSGGDSYLSVDKSGGNFQTAPGTGTDAVTSTAKTTEQAGELIIGVYTDSSAGAGTTVTAGTGFTKREDTGGGGIHSIQIVLEDQVQSAPGSIAATFTEALNHRAATALATFILGAADAPPQVPPRRTILPGRIPLPSQPEPTDPIGDLVGTPADPRWQYFVPLPDTATGIFRPRGGPPVLVRQFTPNIRWVDEIKFDQPVTWYRMNAQGTAVWEVDQGSLGSTGLTTATYQNTPTLGVAGAIAGDSDTAVLFDKTTSEHLQGVDRDEYSIVTTGELSVEWIALATVNADVGVAERMVSKFRVSTNDREWIGERYDSGEYAFRVFQLDSGAFLSHNTFGSPSLNSYHHHVATIKNNGGTVTVKTYLDGNLIDTQTFAFASIGNGVGNLRVASSDAGFPFNGTIDEVAIYSKELSAARVLAHYQATGLVSFAGVVAATATATAAGQAATLLLTIPSSTAAATAAASSSTVLLTIVAGVAASSAAASGSTVLLTIPAGVANATASGQGATVLLKITAGLATATATALPATPVGTGTPVTVIAGVATATAGALAIEFIGVPPPRFGPETVVTWRNLLREMYLPVPELDESGGVRQRPPWLSSG